MKANTARRAKLIGNSLDGRDAERFHEAPIVLRQNPFFTRDLIERATVRTPAVDFLFEVTAVEPMLFTRLGERGVIEPHAGAADLGQRGPIPRTRRR